MKHFGGGPCVTGHKQSGRLLYFVLNKQMSHKLSFAMLGAILVISTLLRALVV